MVSMETNFHLSKNRKNKVGNVRITSGQYHDPAALPTEKRLGYPMNTKLGEPRSRSEHFGERNNCFLNFPALCLVTIATTLSRIPKFVYITFTNVSPTSSTTHCTCNTKTNSMKFTQVITVSFRES